MLETIGDGAYSFVHKVKRRLDGKMYAMKKVLLKKLTEKE